MVECYFMEEILTPVKKHLLTKIANTQTAKKLEIDISEIIIVSQLQMPEFGDYSTPIAMRLGKKLNKNPFDIAESIASEIQKDDFIDKVSVVKPGFINIWITKSTLFQNLKNIIELKEEYGKLQNTQKKTFLIEHTSPNPNKAMHLGHLRNNVTGMAIANIWEWEGIKVIRDSVDNNRGIAIAKLMWGYLKFARKSENTPIDINYWYLNQNEWYTPQDQMISPDIFVDRLYVKGSEDCKDEEVEKKVRQMVIDWENEDKVNMELWKKVLQYTYEGQNKTLSRLGNRWDVIWRESNHYKLGKKIVEEGLKKGIFKKLQDGAILSNLEKYGLTDTILIKSDGTSLYITQDIALTKLKVEKYHPDKIFWTIGPEQSLALRQLFAICDELGIGKQNMFEHISYGLMTLKNKGKISSREGNVIYIDNLIDEVKNKIIGLLDKDKMDVEKTAEILAVGAVKYSILKVGRNTDIAFDIDESISIDGDSGIYIIYTYVRCKSVLEKYAKKLPDINFLEIGATEEELSILRLLHKFTDSVISSAVVLSPNLICSYLFDLAQKFNAFYQKNNILNSEKSVQEFRVLLTFAVSQVIKNGLSILGIQTVDKM